MGWLAVVSVVIAAAALGWTIYRDRKQSEALADETRERKAADAREEERREEQLKLLRQQFERDQRRDQEHQRARLKADARLEETVAERIVYTVRVRNVGQAAAEDVYVWLAERLSGGDFSGPVTPQHRAGTITPTDGWVEWKFAEPWRGGSRRAGVVLALWTDGEGEHRDEEIGRATIIL
jgi:hypothetical protein